MSFDEVEYPRNMAFGSSSGPGHNTGIVQLDSGQEQRIARWDGARWEGKIVEGKKTKHEIAEILTFIRARGGSEHGFRYWDPYDHTSAAVGSGSPGSKDVQIGVGTGSPISFQLLKKYTSGLRTVTRTINKPVAGTTRVWFTDAEQLSGWTIDTTTGLLTATPALGAPVYAAFEYCVPVRFGAEADQLLAAKYDDPEQGSLPDISVIEIINPDPGYLPELPGGAYQISYGANFTISTGQGKTHYINATTTGLSGTLMNTANVPTGGELLRIVNVGANAFTIKNHLGATIQSVGAGLSVVLALVLDGTATKVWFAYA